MTKFGIISLMPDGVRDYHQALRLKLVAQFGLRVNLNVPAHITIKYPFFVEDADVIENVVQGFCGSRTKTDWALQGFDHFINEDSHVVFIDVVSSVATRTAHAQFLDELRKIHWVQWGQFDTSDLRYHVTLATHGLTAENFGAVWAYLEQLEKPNFEVFFDNLVLVRIEENSRTIYKVYPFRN